MATLKVPVNAEDFIQGDPNAPVVLVEYGDYQCPHCGRAHPIVQRLRKNFGDRLAFVFRNFPLNEIHPMAEVAAETAEFAATHGRFWLMHDAIFENQDFLSDAVLIKLAQTMSLSAPDLKAAWSSGEYTPRVKEDFLSGVRSGVNGTPTFFINGHRHDSSYEYADLKDAIDAALSTQQVDKADSQ